MKAKHYATLLYKRSYKISHPPWFQESSDALWPLQSRQKFDLRVPKSDILTLMTLVQRQFVCWKRIYGLILRSHERCNQKKIHQLTSQLAEDRVLANRFLKTKALHTTDLSSDTWKEKSTWNLHVPCFIYSVDSIKRPVLLKILLQKYTYFLYCVMYYILFLLRILL